MTREASVAKESKEKKRRWKERTNHRTIGEEERGSYPRGHGINRYGQTACSTNYRSLITGGRDSSA